MGFIKGKAFPIVNTLAKKGNIKAKNLLLDAPKLEQEKVDNIVAELFDLRKLIFECRNPFLLLYYHSF